MDFDSYEEGMFGEEALQHLLRQRFRNEAAAAQMIPPAFQQFRGLGRAAASESALEKIMQLDEQSSAYMRQGKYFEAYGLLKNQYKLGPKIQFVPVLVKYYVTLMETDQADKANRIRDELAELLREKFEDSAEEICRYAEDVLEKNKLWEAIVFFKIALTYYEKEKRPLEDAQLPQWCAAGLTKCVIKTFLQRPATKKLLKRYVMGWIKKTRELVAKASASDKKFSALVEANLLSHQGRCYMLFRDLDLAEKIFKESVDLMDHYHKPDTENFSNFAENIGFLGFICFQANRHDEAEKHLRRAISAVKEAKDMSPFERAQAIRTHDMILKKIKDQK